MAGLFETMPLPRLFGAVFLTTAVSAVVLALLVKPDPPLDERRALTAGRYSR